MQAEPGVLPAALDEGRYLAHGALHAVEADERVELFEGRALFPRLFLGGEIRGGKRVAALLLFEPRRYGFYELGQHIVEIDAVKRLLRNVAGELEIIACRLLSDKGELLLRARLRDADDGRKDAFEERIGGERLVFLLRQQRRIDAFPGTQAAQTAFDAAASHEDYVIVVYAAVLHDVHEAAVRGRSSVVHVAAADERRGYDAAREIKIIENADVISRRVVRLDDKGDVEVRFPARVVVHAPRDTLQRGAEAAPAADRRGLLHQPLAALQRQRRVETPVSHAAHRKGGENIFFDVRTLRGKLFGGNRRNLQLEQAAEAFRDGFPQLGFRAVAHPVRQSEKYKRYRRILAIRFVKHHARRKSAPVDFQAAYDSFAEHIFEHLHAGIVEPAEFYEKIRAFTVHGQHLQSKRRQRERANAPAGLCCFTEIRQSYDNVSNVNKKRRMRLSILRQLIKAVIDFCTAYYSRGMRYSKIGGQYDTVRRCYCKKTELWKSARRAVSGGTSQP